MDGATIKTYLVQRDASQNVAIRHPTKFAENAKYKELNNKRYILGTSHLLKGYKTLRIILFRE